MKTKVTLRDTALLETCDSCDEQYDGNDFVLIFLLSAVIF